MLSLTGICEATISSTFGVANSFGSLGFLVFSEVGVSPLICVVGTVLPEFTKRGQRHDGYTEKKSAASAVRGRHRNS